MAIVSGPLFSLGATGQIAKTLVMSTWKGIKTARQYVRPANPQTTGQVAQRNAMETVVAEWGTTGTTELLRGAWNRLAANLSSAMSGFNAYVSFVLTAYVATSPAIDDLYLLSAINIDGANVSAQFAAVKGTSGTETVELWTGATAKKLTLSTSGAATSYTKDFTTPIVAYCAFKVNGVWASGIIPVADIPPL